VKVRAAQKNPETAIPFPVKQHLIGDFTEQGHKDKAWSWQFGVFRTFNLVQDFL